MEMTMTEEDRLDLICVEIGSRGHLSLRDAKRAAATWQQMRRLHPEAEFIFAVQGYDDDPRALWEIPEVAAYVRSWARLVGLDSPEAAERVFGSLDERQVGATLGLLDMCLVFGDEPIFTRGERPH
jgi:hypothetical protein